MPSTRTRLVFGAAWLLFWVLMITVGLQDYLRQGGTRLWQPVLWEGTSAIASTALLFLQRRLTRRHDALIANPRRWFARQLVWLPLSCISFVPVTFGMRHGVYALLGETYRHEPWLQVFVYESVKVSLFFCLFIVVLFGILSYQALLRERERSEQAHALLHQAQLQRLAQQMQPHFLFNALNTVSSLMHSDVERADATLVQLADVLRATLAVGDRQQASLDEELRLARGYARLMAERFADRVQLDWQIDAAALQCQLPVMGLQPLIENVFKHTVEQQRGLTRILVEATLQDGRLQLRVEDDRGSLGPENAGGIGLANLRARLQSLHGGDASLTLSALAPAGVRCEMLLPCGC